MYVTMAYSSLTCRIEGMANGGVAFHYAMPCLNCHKDLIELTSRSRS